MLSLCAENQSAFRMHLFEQEYSQATIGKYLRDIRLLAQFCEGTIENKNTLIAFKGYLVQSGYAAASINSMIASVNRFLVFCGKAEWKIRFLKIQKKLFLSKERELSRNEYMDLVKAADKCKNERLSMILQTICSTGIRVSELRSITVESLKKGCAQIQSKGKMRQIILPKKLCAALRAYCRKKEIHSGMVFVTRSGREIDRSNLWKMIKNLAEKAGIQKKKAFPHNLRHLFARTYYEKYRDIVWLADILGHSSVNTTRIYTMKNMHEQVKKIDGLPLLLDMLTI